MRLDQELVKRGLCESRTEAQGIIESGNVLVNGSIATKQTKQVAEIDVIEVTARRKFVSRGGEKLEGVLFDIKDAEKKYSINEHSIFNENANSENLDNKNEGKIREMLEGKTALDVGSSTGGFTDCLLSYGVSHVDAVDVGTLQLHEKIRNDARVSVFENTDIRNFKNSTPYEIIVADLSFIPLTHVFDDIVRFGAKGALYFLLIKPQFEVGKGNTKKGIVKDEQLVNGILDDYKILAKEKGMTSVQIFLCHIQGGDGNQEYFLVCEKK
ncbi:MAG: TlyA family RNA methyltransferase [Candidatus Paceibacterota bacterium]